MSTGALATQRFTSPEMVGFEARDVSYPSKENAEAVAVVLGHLAPAVPSLASLAGLDRLHQMQDEYGNSRSHRYFMVSRSDDYGEFRDIGAIHTIARRRWLGAGLAGTSLVPRLTVLEAAVTHPYGSAMTDDEYGDVAATLLRAATDGYPVTTWMGDRPDKGDGLSPFERLQMYSGVYLNNPTSGAVETAVLQNRRWLAHPTVRMNESVPEQRKIGFADVMGALDITVDRNKVQH